MQSKIAWHQIPAGDCIANQQSDLEQGLSSEQVRSRRVEHGLNELIESGGRGVVQILWDQVRGAMVLLLIVAAAVSFYLDERTDAVVILAIVIINAGLGFFQDYRAERALAALKKLAVPLVRVKRDGRVVQISARELVPGDIVQLEVGNQVPADGRLLESAGLKIQEAALTGESEAVEKQVEALSHDDLPLGDRTNMSYMGTIVTYGHGQALVVATGMDTELGQIARSLQSVEAEPTPLQLRLTQLGRSLALIALGIVAVVFLLGVVRGESPRLMLMTALSLAVAVVPEGLPAVATVALALGAKRMFARHALIRKLPAVETLGSVTVICSDKTGTLTENRMTVTVVDVAGEQLELTQTLKRGQPQLDDNPSPEAADIQHSIRDNSSIGILLTGLALCNDSEIQWEPPKQRYRAIGDPTENALAIAATRLGFAKDMLLPLMPRVAELPFDSERKRMTTVHRMPPEHDAPANEPVAQVLSQLRQLGGSHLAFTKGAADRLLDVCEFVWDQGERQPMDPNWEQRIHQANERLAAKGMRVLGVAFRNLQERDAPEELNPGSSDGEQESKLIFLGLVAMIDPPRPEVAEAIEHCRTAGIRPLMITGDHPLTALHIARQLHICENDRVLTGLDLEKLDQEELRQRVRETSVYARVAPTHKLRLVQALQDNEDVVAMTGDGVNDAPALKQAHIGVAMGITGTDVSKEAAQMVLMDDNFATIVNAVEEGRIVYDNIRKFVKYTMTSNAGEMCVMILGPLLGMPLPLLPLQILWINLVTDGLPGIALAMEKAERDTMQRPPYPPSEHVFARGLARDIAWIGILMGVVSLAMGYAYWAWREVPATHWRTLVFTVLTLAQMGNALAIRSTRDSVFSIGFASNPMLLASIALTFVMQLAVIYWAPLQQIFRTQALSWSELLACVALSTVVFWAVEAHKLWLRTRGDRT